MCPVAMAMNYKEVMYDPFPPKLYMNTIYVIIKRMHHLRRPGSIICTASERDYCVHTT